MYLHERCCSIIAVVNFDLLNNMSSMFEYALSFVNYVNGSHFLVMYLVSLGLLKI